MLRQDQRVLAVGRVDGHTYAGRERHGAVAEPEGLGQGDDQSIRQRLHPGRLLEIGLHQREFVAAQSRQDIGLADLAL